MAIGELLVRLMYCHVCLFELLITTNQHVSELTPLNWKKARLEPGPLGLGKSASAAPQCSRRKKARLF
jgi:hypothetical protein